MSHKQHLIRFRRELTPESIRDEFYRRDRTHTIWRPDDCGGIFIEEAEGRIRLVPHARFLWTLHILDRPSSYLLQFLDLLGARVEVKHAHWRRVSRYLDEYFAKPEIEIDTGELLPCVLDLPPTQQSAVDVIDEIAEGTSCWIHFMHLNGISLGTLRALEAKSLIKLDEVKLRAKLLID